MSKSEVEILKEALEREKAARLRERASRKAAEKILEDKSRELYHLSNKLKETNLELEKLLDEKSIELKGIYDNINDAYVVIDLGGNVLKMNDMAAEIFEYDINFEEFNVNDTLLEDQIEATYESFEKLMTKGSLNNFESQIRTKTGKIKWVQINASAIFENGQPIAAQGIIRDVTQEKKSRQLLRASESRLSNLILNLHSGILLEDEKGNIVLTNNRFCEIFDIPSKPEELIGVSCARQLRYSKDIFLDPTSEFSKMKDLITTKVQITAEEVIFKDGSIYERDFIPIFSDGEHKGNLWSYRDVTLRRKYRKSLEKERAKYSNIIANMNLGLIEVDNDDRILFANQGFCEMSGYTQEDLLGNRGKDVFLTEADKHIIDEQNKDRLTGKSNSFELRVKTKNGDNRTWLVSGAPNYNIQGDVIGSIGIHLDITEIKSLQEQKEIILKQLEQSNKELHEYAHIVSHDLKSPLRSIDALVSWIKEDNKDKFDDLTMENFSLVEKTLETMEMLISDVLRYSKVGFNKSRNKAVNLNDVIQRLVDALYIPNHISVEVQKNLPTLRGNKTELLQLFQNLISNAVKFIDKPDGLIKIDCAELENHYQFSIADNGIGIAEKYHDKIFQIFHSLKKSKESTGIGLSIVKKIIDNYDGKIWLESQPGEGTTFFFTLKKG
ncbi:MAG: PAS domain-containing sensor histidine kinase [Flavobacteriaceae bacterium]|nr:PAS domain-containing sensor histidine kinase [Flavobacteriaceae bacterium]|tara:strand:- start:156146 stop:158146 length:2001 start_codon:yes stop_codon:yes gene_type:complete